VTRRQRTVQGFARRYTEEDIRLLAAMDARHDTQDECVLSHFLHKLNQLNEVLNIPASLW